jgi:hypothetical protein
MLQAIRLKLSSNKAAKALKGNVWTVYYIPVDSDCSWLTYQHGPDYPITVFHGEKRLSTEGPLASFSESPLKILFGRRKVRAPIKNVLAYIRTYGV